jgi:hypothetical protein
MAGRAMDRESTDGSHVELMAYDRVLNADDHYETEDEDGHDGEFEEVDMPGSLYGVAIFCLSHDVTEVLTPEAHDDLPAALNAFRTVYCLAMLIVNYMIQGMLLLWSNFFVVNPSVTTIQNLYGEYHREVYDAVGVDDSKFNIEKWESFDQSKKVKLCQVPLSHPMFTLMIVWLWAMRMTSEFRETYMLFSEINSVEGTKSLDKVITVGKDGSGNRIRRLTMPLRAAMYLLVVLPKFALNVALFVIGTRWLVATPDFAGLILNALALGFIIDVDELLHGTFVPKKMQATVDDTKFYLPKASLDEEIADRWTSYRTSFFWFMSGLITVWIYLHYGQAHPVIAVLPGYQYDLAHHCHDVLTEITQNLCRNLDNPLNCFPYGDRIKTR